MNGWLRITAGLRGAEAPFNAPQSGALRKPAKRFNFSLICLRQAVDVS